MKWEVDEMTSIKTLVAEGRYEVDSRLVAEAVMVRLFGLTRAGGLSQSQCSKPSSSVSQSKNLTPG